MVVCNKIGVLPLTAPSGIGAQLWTCPGDMRSSDLLLAISWPGAMVLLHLHNIAGYALPRGAMRRSL